MWRLHLQYLFVFLVLFPSPLAPVQGRRKLQS
jgi:hypothetical protein